MSELYCVNDLWDASGEYPYPSVDEFLATCIQCLRSAFSEARSKNARD